MVSAPTVYRMAILLLAVLMVSCTPPLIKPARLEVTPGANDVQTTTELAAGRTIIHVVSPSGIGSATLKSTGGPFTSQLEIRLYLHGLEKLDFIYGDTQVTVSVTSAGQHVAREVARNIKTGTAKAINADSPYWIPVSRVTGSTRLQPPPSVQDYYSLLPPADLVASDYSTFSIRWIDFYR